MKTKIEQYWHGLMSVGVIGLLFTMGSCIENDLPYPRIQVNITQLAVENEERPSTLDSVNLTATVYLNERADIYNVKVTEMSLTPGAHLVDSMAFVDGVDLSSPRVVTLTLYQDYEWTITARQEIERFFQVANQVGMSEIDIENHTVNAMVTAKTDLKEVKVERIKLGSVDATMMPNIAGTTEDFTKPVTIAVTDYGRTVDWTITIEKTKAVCSISSIDPWSEVAWVYTEAESGRDNGLEYRMIGATNWTSVPEGWISHEGGSYKARLIHLEPLTTYEVRPISDGVYGEIETFTTGLVAPLPNNDFTQWWKDGKVWCPWSEDGEAFWGTGNKGAATLGNSNTTPILDSESITGYSGALLESRFIGVSILGKLAAGNLFSGKYKATDGTNGILEFGREFTERPTRLRARIKYTPVEISHTNSEYSYMKGEPDTCTVYCALADWEEPFEIRTNPKNRQLFDPEDEHVIAYGIAQFGYELPEYVDVDITLDYRATNRVPRYILVVASASKYGDYFTGGNGSTLWVKSLTLGYDYED